MAVEKLNFEDFGAWVPLTLGGKATPDVFFKASRENSIIIAIAGIDSEALRNAYVTNEFKAKLQVINNQGNQGIQESLKNSAAYDPFKFQSQIQKLQAMLPSL